MIEVFKTDIQTEEQAETILSAIDCLSGLYQSNFDLEDVDRILRIESRRKDFNVGEITRIIESKGFKAEVLTE